MAGLSEGGGGSGAIRAGRAYVQLFLNDNAIYRGLDRVQARLRKAGEFLTSVGTKALVGGGLTLAPIVKVFADFDDAIRLTKAVSGATAAEFDVLRNTALELGRTTSFTAAQVANLMAELGRAGFKPTEIVAMTGAVLDLARATGTDAVVASGIMAATLRQFGLGAGEATRVADGLTAAANKSFNTVTDLGEALKYAGPVAADLGMSLEDTLAILGGLGNVGIRGEMGGTTLRRLVTLIGKGGKDLERIFGVAGTNARGNLRPLVDVLEDVFNATKDMPNALRTEKFDEFFGLLGITGASAIGKSAVSIRELRTAILAAGGTAGQTAKEMDAGLGGAIRILLSALEGAGIAIGDAFSQPLMILGGILTEAAGGITRFVNENRDLVTAIGTGVVVMLAAGAAAVALGLAFKAAALVVGVFLAVFNTLAFVVGAFLTVIGGVLSFGALFLATFQIAAMGGVVLLEVLSRIADMVPNLFSGFGTMVEGVANAFRNMAATFSEAWEGIVAAVKKGDMNLAFRIAAAGIKAIWYGLLIDLGKAFARFVEENRRTIVAIGATLGVMKGARIGSRFGPLGTAAGVVVGGVTSGSGAAALADALEGMGDMPRMAAARDAATAEMKRLVAEAKADLPAAAAAAVDPAELDRQRFLEEMAKKAMPPIDRVKGGFAVPVGRLQFGYGDSWQKKTLNAAEETAKNTAETAMHVLRLLGKLRFG